MQDESGESPSLQQLGEFAVIDRLVRGREQPAAVVLGPGDDAALVSSGDGRALVSTDMLVQDRHFRLDWSTPHDIGRKAIAQNAATGPVAMNVFQTAPPARSRSASTSDGFSTKRRTVDTTSRSRSRSRVAGMIQP